MKHPPLVASLLIVMLLGIVNSHMHIAEIGDVPLRDYFAVAVALFGTGYFVTPLVKNDGENDDDLDISA